MKLKLIAVTIPAMIMATSAFAVEGEHSTVNFNGNIVEATCSLAAGSKDQTVTLGDVSTNAFSGANTTAAEKDFTIDLESCDTAIAQQASLTFSGETANDTALKTSEGDTTKVGIQILQGGQPLILDGSTASVPLTLTDGDENSMPFSARYIALDEAVAAGAANATANFTVSYE